MRGTWLAAIFLCGLGVLFCAPFLFGESILFPKHTASFLPWRDETPPDRVRELDRAANPLMTDKVYMFHPQLLRNKEALRRGQLPLWDPYTLAGIPYLAEGLPAVFSLVNFPYLIMAPERAYGWIALLQTVLGAVFMLLLLRALGCAPFPAAAGGLAFGFSGWMLARLHYFMITGAAIWLPLMLLAVERIVRARRPAWILALAFGCFQTLCAGFPQVAAMNLYLSAAFAGACACALLRKEGLSAALRRLALAAVGFFAGILLAGIQLFPSMEMAFSEDSTRVMATLDQLREKPLEPVNLAAYAAPDLFGDPDLTYRTQSPYFRDSSLLSLALLPRRVDQNALEINGYVGILPLVLALLAWRARPRASRFFPGFFGGALAFSLLAALGIPGVVHLTAALPGLAVGDLKRFLFPAAACLVVLAAFTLDAVRDPEGAARVRFPAVLLFLLLAAAAAAGMACLAIAPEAAVKDLLARAIHRNLGLKSPAAVLAHVSDADFGTWKEHTLEAGLRVLLLSVLGGAVFLLYALRKGGPRFTRVLLAAVLVLDLFSLGWRLDKPMPAGPPLYDGSNPVVRFLAEHAGYGRIVRFKDEALYPVNAGMVHHLFDIQGYTAFYFQRYRRFLDLLAPERSDAYGMPCLIREESLASPLLDLLGVRYVLARERIEANGAVREAFRHKHVRVYENPDPLPRAFLAPGAVYAGGEEEAAVRLASRAFDPRRLVVIEGAPPAGETEAKGTLTPARIVTYEPERVVLKVRGGPGWLVLTDAFAPGWQASLDGESVPVRPADLAFRGVWIPDEAAHEVVFHYRPGSVRLGAYLSLAGLVLCLGIAAGLWVHRVRTGRETPRGEPR